MQLKASISHDEAIVRELKENPEFAEEYLKTAIEDTDEPKVLLIALRHLVEANGGFSEVAKKAGMERTGLYRTLSANGNPVLSTLVALMTAIGFKLSVEAIHCKENNAVGPRRRWRNSK